MKSKEELREIVKSNLDLVVNEVNDCLAGKTITDYEEILHRLGRGGNLPHWYEHLKNDHTLPNLDGKTVGSVLEMLLVAVIEKKILSKEEGLFLRINPARGVDLPDLDLGIKSPSENYCTSEPYFSAYERLIGGDYDSLVLLTDYQSAKKTPPLHLKVIKWKYLRHTQIADFNLCSLARKHRELLLANNEIWAQKFFRFLAYVNQSDWRAKHLLNILWSMDNEEEVIRKIKFARVDFEIKNKILEKKELGIISDSEIQSIENIQNVSPSLLGIIDAIDNWTVESLKEAARMPNENELSRLRNGPIDGLIGMSFALQWRYNFSKIFSE